MFYIDKYSPIAINECQFHKNILTKLKTMSADNMIPNLLFYGPEGSGKSTLIRLFLEMIFDNDINKISDVSYNVVGCGNIINEIKVKQSNYHIIIEPNNNNFDRYLVQDIVKQYAKRIPFNIFKTKMYFRVILINNVHKLSYYAQTSLRRTMEQYSNNCRFILCSESLSKVLEPLRSRCILINVHSLSDNKLFEFILLVSIKEKQNITLQQLINITQNSNGNIKNALWMLQLHKYELDIYNTYDKCIKSIIDKIILKQIKDLEQIIELFYKIIITNISCTKIIKDIAINLCLSNTIPLICKYYIIQYASKYESRLIKGRRDIIHLQAFLCNVINIINIHT